MSFLEEIKSMFPNYLGAMIWGKMENSIHKL